MKTTELIHGFVDGSLSVEEENLLFDAMRSDSGIRSELRDSMLIESSMKSSVSGIGPSAAASNAIFSNLGFSVPNAAVNTAVSTSLLSVWGSKFAALHANFGQRLYSALFASLATAIIILYFLMPGDFEYNYSNAGLVIYDSTYVDDNAQSIASIGTDQSGSNNNSTGLIEDNNRSNNLINRFESRGSTTNFANTDSDIYEQNENIIAENDGEAESNNEFTDADILKDSDVKYVFYRENKDDNSLDVVYIPEYNIGNEANDILTQPEFLTTEKLGLSLEVFGSLQNSYQDEFISPAYTPNFANSSIGLSYKLDDDFSIGLGLNQEFFYQEYSGVGDDGKNYKYYQMPNLLTYNTYLRYNIFKFQNFDVLSQISLGLNKAGFVGGFMLGLAYSPSPDYRLILGLNNSVLSYHHKSNSFFSSKYALVYGMQFNF